MKGKLKKFISGFFTIALVLSSLAGCGGDGKSGETTTASTGSATTSSTAGSQNYWDMLDTAKDSSDLPDWTGKQMKVSLWYTHGLGESNHATATNNVVTAEAKRVTGVEIDLDKSFDNGGNPFETKLSMLAAANDWPSVVLIPDTYSAKSLVENNKLYDLTELLPKYAPHIAKIFLQEKDGKLQGISRKITDSITAKTSDKISFVPLQANGVLTYQLATQQPNFDQSRWNYVIPPATVTNNTVWVRDDLLKKLYPNAMTMDDIEAVYAKDGTFTSDQIFDLGLKTKDDFFKFMYNMKALIDKEQIKEDGKPVEVTYAASGTDNWQLMACLLPQLNGYAGINYTINYNKKSGNMEYTFDKEYFKTELKDAWQAVKDGVMSQESLLENNQIFTEKVNSGHYAVTYSWIKPDPEVLKKAGKTYRYRPVWVDSTYDLAQFPLLSDPPQNALNLGIFKDSVKEEDLPQLLRYLDYMCSDIGDRLHYWGPRSAGLFTEDANGNRTYVDKDLEENMVYNKDNGKNVYYGLYNYRIANPNRAPWPQMVVWSDEDWNCPRYTYTNRVKSTAEAATFFTPAILPGKSQADVRIATNMTGAIGAHADVNNVFQKGRDAYEKSLTKILAAKDEAQFDKLYADFVNTVKSLGMDDALIQAADKNFKAANKDIMDKINAK